MKKICVCVVWILLGALLFIPGEARGQQANLSVFTTLLQMKEEPKWQVDLSTVKYLQMAADTRTQVNKLAALGVQVAAVADPRGKVGAETQVMRQDLDEISRHMRAMAPELAGLMQNQTAANQSLAVQPDKVFADAYFVRSRVVSDLFTISTYFAAIGELTKLGVTCIDKANGATKGADAAMLLDEAASFLTDAGNYMALAGSRLNSGERDWLSLQRAVVDLQLRK